MRYGFVGLGNMGGHLAASLIRAGFDVVAFDRKPEASRRHAAMGAVVATSLVDLAGQVDHVTGARAALCVPLVSSEGTIGSVTIGSSREDYRFTSDDVRLLSTIANHVTIAVLKALGAQSRHIHQAFLLAVGILMVAGLTCGTTIGLFIGTRLGRILTLLAEALF